MKGFSVCLKYSITRAILVFFTCVPSCANANGMDSTKVGDMKIRDVFAAMPDSVIPYLSKNNCLDMIDFAEMNMKAEVTNKFDEKCEMVSLTNKYLKIKLADDVVVEMRIRKTDQCLPDSSSYVVDVLTTYGHAPQLSMLSMYSSSWNVIKKPHLLNGYVKQLVGKNQYTTDKEWRIIEDAKNRIFVVGNLVEDENAILLQPSINGLTKEEKQMIEGKVELKKLKINL